MREVFSSHVSKAGYDAETGEMHVQWDSGKTSVYSGVPSALADEVLNAWSVGAALAARIKGQYEHRYV
jgi:hypothetical protein